MCIFHLWRWPMWLKKIPLNRELFSILTILSLFGSGESKPFIIRYCENWNLLSQLEGQNPHGWNIAFKVQTKFTFNDFVFWKIIFFLMTAPEINSEYVLRDTLFFQSIKISLASPLYSFFGTFKRFLQLN